MTNLGKTALALTVLALIGGFVLAAMLGKYHNAWSQTLATAREKSEAAIEQRDQAELQLLTTQAELARTKLGWGYEWSLSAQNAPQINGNVLSVPIGTQQGINVRNVNDDQGQQQRVGPPIHVFTGDQNGQSRYLGEFTLAGEPGPNQSSLQPTWFVSPEELQTWDFSNGTRLRSQIPPGERAAVEGANQQVQRLREGILQANRNIAEQQALLASVQEQLDFRKKELLGNPDLERIPERPEYSDGLVRALVDTEEERNEIQDAVDDLRRRIKSAADQRDALLSQLSSLIAELPRASSRISQRP